MPYTIVIDAGHGGSDPGAVYEGRREKDDNLSLAIAVGELLSRQGVSVIYTRTTDVYQTPFEKAQMANQADADFFISFHRNSSEEPNQYTGVETLVYDNSGIKQTMAENINGALSELGFRNLGVKARPGLVVLRRTKMPALLIETGFLNSDEDNKLYDEKKKAYHNKVKENYNAIYSAISEMNKVSNALKLELTYDAQGPILRRKNSDGTEVKVTMDEYKKEVQKMITSDKMQIINHGKGIEIKQLELKSNASISDLSSIIKEIFTECAMAYDIPVAAYMGTITEKSDAANEFITYAVSPVLSIIEDSMNAKLVGEECYLSGERIWIDISRYKHVDVIECADKLDKLRSIGFNFDEVRNLIGWDELQTDFSKERVITKNYTNDLGSGENKGTE